MNVNELEKIIPQAARDFFTPGSGLSLRYGGSVDDLLKNVMERPLADMLGRPCKRIRGRLVEIGFLLAQPDASEKGATWEHCRRLAEAIEYLHAGSLAVDDVQDGSRMRRGQPSLHMRYGLPLALNIGNYLYFKPLEIIQELNLPAEMETALYRLYHRTLLRAHLGQAMDIGLAVTDLPQERVADVCLASMELKSGALFSLALVMGAIVGGASPNNVDAIDDFGHGFGIGLQMFDDIGNVKGKVEPAKRWEDLVLRRPTWIWARNARHLSSADYRRFVEAVLQLPTGRRSLEEWFKEKDIFDPALSEARLHLEACQAVLESRLPGPEREPAFHRLRQLASEISRAYE